MRIALLGGTGGTGAQFLQQALDAGHEVAALARNPAAVTVKHPKLTVVQGDANAAAAMAELAKGAGAVVSCIGSSSLSKTSVRGDAARTMTAAMKQAGVKRLVWLSAAGVADNLEQTRRSSFLFGRILIPLMLKNVYADAAVAEGHVRQSGLDFTVVRAVGLNNKPKTGKVGAVTDATQKIPGLSITRADVAAWMLDAATNGKHIGELPVIYGEK